MVLRIRGSGIRPRMARRRRIRKMLSALAVERRAIMLKNVEQSQQIGSASTTANWDITRINVRSPLKRSRL